MTTTATRDIGEMTWHLNDWQGLVFRTKCADELPHSRARNSGRLLFELDVDGQWTIVSVDTGQTGDLQLVRAAIENLVKLEAELVGIYGESERGRCLFQGDWGRRGSENNHAGGHDVPTEAEFMATLSPVRAESVSA